MAEAIPRGDPAGRPPRVRGRAGPSGGRAGDGALEFARWKFFKGLFFHGGSEKNKMTSDKTLSQAILPDIEIQWRDICARLRAL